MTSSSWQEEKGCKAGQQAGRRPCCKVKNQREEGLRGLGVKEKSSKGKQKWPQNLSKWEQALGAAFPGLDVPPQLVW